MEYINVTEFRNNIAEFINNVHFKNKRYTLIKSGKPVAIINPAKVKENVNRKNSKIS